MTNLNPSEELTQRQSRGRASVIDSGSVDGSIGIGSHIPDILINCACYIEKYHILLLGGTIVGRVDIYTTYAVILRLNVDFSTDDIFTSAELTAITDNMEYLTLGDYTGSTDYDMPELYNNRVFGIVYFDTIDTLYVGVHIKAQAFIYWVHSLTNHKGSAISTWPFKHPGTTYMSSPIFGSTHPINLLGLSIDDANGIVSMHKISRIHGPSGAEPVNMLAMRLSEENL